MLGMGVEYLNDIVINNRLSASSLKLLPNRPMPNINKINGIRTLIDVVEKYKIDKKKFIIGASSALVALGAIDHNDDIDVCFDPEYRKLLLDKGMIVIQNNDHANYSNYIIKNTDIDCGVVGNENLDFKSVCALGSTEISGYLFLNIYGCFAFYNVLLKKLTDAYFQTKFTKRIQLLTDVVSKWVDHICYHSSAQQNLKKLQSTTCKAYPDYGPVVFASYSKVFSLMFGCRNLYERLEWDFDTDGITPHFTFEFTKKISESEVHRPFSCYILKDNDFFHMLSKQEGMEDHPILEILHKGDIRPVQEEQYEDWWEVMLFLERKGYITIKNKHFLQ